MKKLPSFMKKLPSFLDTWGVGIQIVLVIAWFLWALQAWGPFKEVFSQENRSKITREQMVQARKEQNLLSEKFAKEAEEMGDNYGPKEYFAHLKILRTKSWESGVSSGMGTVQRFQDKFNKNRNARKFTQAEFIKEVNKYSIWHSWLRNNGRPPENVTLKEWGNWALKCYFRTILLLIPFYLVNMNYDKGILETLLAGKTKFILAIVFWPFLFARYPRNVIREIRVEAELRRLGCLFRRLTQKEVALIREVANSPNYKQWLSQTRNYNRGLVIALTITIIINLLPSTAKAQSTTSELTIISMSSCQQVENSVGETPNDSMPAIIEEPPSMEPPKVIATIGETETLAKSREPETTKHIPVISLLLNELKRTAIVIAKGMYNAYNNHNHLNLRISFG